MVKPKLNSPEMSLTILQCTGKQHSYITVGQSALCVDWDGYLQQTVRVIILQFVCPLNVMCGRFKSSSHLICSSDRLSLTHMASGCRSKLTLQSLLSLVSVAGTWIYALKISERPCSHKASSVHSLFDFYSSANLTLEMENTSPVWESVPACKGEGERERERRAEEETMNEEHFKSRPPPLLQNISLAPPGEADSGRRRRAD